METFEANINISTVWQFNYIFNKFKWLFKQHIVLYFKLLAKLKVSEAKPIPKIILCFQISILYNFWYKIGISTYFN